MNFGPVNAELLPGARNAVETCLNVQAGERVALIADQPSREVAASLAEVLAQRRAQWAGLLVEDVAARPVVEAPRELLQALENAEVGILCMQPMPGELPIRMAIVRVVERRRIRYAHMVGVTAEIMQQGMRTDYRMVDRLSDRLRERMKSASTLRVQTEAGTEFTASFNPALDWVKTSGLISPQYWSNLPAGEVFTTPARVDGRFVCDGTAGDYFNQKYGDLQRTPLVLEIVAGRLVRAECAQGAGGGVLGVYAY